MGWRLLDKRYSLVRGVQYKLKGVGAGGGVGGVDNRRLYEWRRQLDHELISMLSFNVSISCSIFKTNQ